MNSSHNAWTDWMRSANPGVVFHVFTEPSSSQSEIDVKRSGSSSERSNVAERNPGTV